MKIEAVNIRDYAFNKHQSVDDYPYGGGAGMLMQAEPVYQAYSAVTGKDQIRKPGGTAESGISFPAGRRHFLRRWQKTMRRKKNLILLCGHYEGIDERVLEEIVTDYVSIGDYVLTGGELPAMVMVDTISRLFPGYCTMMFLQNLIVFRIICWNIRSIPDRKNGTGKKCRRF